MKIQSPKEILQCFKFRFERGPDGTIAAVDRLPRTHRQLEPDWVTPQFFSACPADILRDTMPRVQKRKYEKIDEAEIALVTQCNDSHEFYEKYRETFPTRKKGIDSISKIWKRRSEFIKKQGGLPDQEPGTVSNQELISMLTAQNKILSDMTGLMKEQLKVSRDILSSLQRPDAKPAPAPRQPETVKHDQPRHEPPRAPETKEPARKPAHDKPPADIMIGS